MIYFDNSATSYPKPPPVINKAYFAMKYYSFNSGRGGYVQSLKAAQQIYAVREKVAALFACEAENVVFTKNCTEALNFAIKGSVREKDHIIISSLEHNSVGRVVENLFETSSVEYDIADFSYDDSETISNFESLVKENTKAIVCMHSSNVFGVVFPIKEIGAMCRRKGIRFIVDAAQGGGISDINMKRDNIDILCCAGHKSLYGPMGTGVMCVREGIDADTLIQGGTGSSSLSLKQPDFMPDRFEAGTLNNSGIIALGGGIDYINKVGMRNIYEKEIFLSRILYYYVSKAENSLLYTPAPVIDKFVPIVSFNIQGKSSESVASYLADKGVCVRAGFHCSPLAHAFFGTQKDGTVRLSPGAFNTEKECEKFYDIIKKI